MYSAPPCVYKRGRRTPSFGRSHHHLLTRNSQNTHTRSLEPRYWHLPQSPPLAGTWELPSLSRLACIPYYRHPRCKIVQCTRTPLLDVRPRGQNQDKSMRYCVASCINIWGEETRSITSWDPDRRVRTPTNMSCISSSKKPPWGKIEDMTYILVLILPH